MRTTLSRTASFVSAPFFAFIAAIVCIPAFAQDPSAQPAAGDPPGRVARISFLQGNVSLEPAGVDTFSQAEMNYPLTVGDRVYADLQALAELQTAGLDVRMGNGADVTLSSLTDQVAQIGLAQGSIRVATHDLLAPDGTTGVVEIDTPNGSIVVQIAGDIRVDSYPQDDSTVVTVTSGQVEITAPGIDQVLSANQSLKLAGANPVTAQLLQLLPPDTLDRFDSDRESMFQSAVNQEAQYVSPDMIGASDLEQYGDWTPAPDYGEVWYPRGVAVGWTPYSNGHWAWVAPWGWTWVEAEPWGFAPFHYGRWNNFGGRWGWIPGPPPPVWGRPVRPIYSPALVAFVGGPNFSLSIGFGGGSGAGVAAWFPLGPGEPYVPWYHAGPGYVNRVNVTNIYSRNVAEVRTNFTNRTTNVYGNNVTNVTYVNRTVGTTAVSQQDFAAGHSVARSQPLRLDATARQQLAQAPILPHPLVTPAATIAAPQAPARALPAHTARPVLETRGSYSRPETPAAAPVTRPAQQAAPVPQNLPQQRPHQPAATPPATTPHAEVPAAQAQPAPVQRVQPAPAEAVAPRPVDQPRTLINRTPPQPAQPSFQEQQKAIEQHDPGRPLGPQQVNNIRQGRPAGPAAQPEPVQHPAPGRPAPPPPPRPAPHPQV